MRLGAKASVVTGAGSGIGRVVALRLAREESMVAVVDIDGASASKVCDEIRANGGRAISLCADVSNAEQVNAMMTAAAKSFGRIDVLVNNAGIVVRSPLEHTSDADWERELAVDLASVFLCSRAVVAHMRPEGGTIVNIASVAGVIGAVSPAYTAAKGGVIALSRELAGELATEKIRVNSVSPGFIATPLNAQVREAGLESVLAARIPLRRWGTPEDVAGACAYLASDDARYVTGTNLVVDGGLSSYLDLGDAYRSFDTSRPNRDSQ